MSRTPIVLLLAGRFHRTS